MELLENYLNKIEFEDYEDFKQNLKVIVPENFDFARDIVDKWAEIEPNKLALLYCNDFNEEKRYTFKDISTLSKKAATYFTKLGIKKGDRVLTLLRRRAEYWFIAVALHRIGAVVVPASIQLTKKDVLYRLKNAHVKALIAIDDSFVLKQIEGVKEEAEELKHVIIVSDKAQNIGHDFNREFIRCEEFEGYSGLSNNDEMIIYFTSGTSGYPKMAVHNRRYPLGHIITAKYMQAVQNNGLHITQADSGWAKFGWGNIYGQWICGSAILGYDPIRFDAYRFRKMLKKYKPTTMCIPPTMYRLILTDGLEADDVKSIQHFSTAGEPLSGEINKEFFYLTDHYIFEGFGQSESTPFTCTFKYLDVKPASMGRPSPLYDIKLLKSDGTFAGVNEPGEVVITNAKTALGLLDHYVLNDQRIDCIDYKGIYHTGDIAYMDNDGYFWYVSRNDDMIKSSGYRIGPFEIESVLNTHPSVTESAIIGLPDPIRGQVICAVIHLAEGYKPSYELTKELQDYVKVNTAPYKYPRTIVYAKELPKTTSGKIIRHDILKQIEINPVKEKSCGAIIYKYENGGLRFLISKHKQGHYSFTKGHVEKNETEVETALREIKEETYLDVKLDTGFREINTYSPKLGTIKDVVYFIAAATSEKIIVQEHEIIEAIWLSYEEALKTITNDSDKEILKKAYAYLK